MTTRWQQNRDVEPDVKHILHLHVTDTDRVTGNQKKSLLVPDGGRV